MPELQLNHLAIVIDDLDSALSFWRDGLGLSPSPTQSIADEMVDITFLELGNARIELVQPTSPESGVAKYLAKRGPGMHHLCLEAPDLDSVLDNLRARGCELINDQPRFGPDRRYAFVHPKSTGGVLLELYERLP